MIFLYGILFVAVIILILYVYGLIADQQREISTLKTEKHESAVAMKKCMDWIDDVAKLEPLTALKEVQCQSNARNETG